MALTLMTNEISCITNYGEIFPLYILFCFVLFSCLQINKNILHSFMNTAKARDLQRHL